MAKTGIDADGNEYMIRGPHSKPLVHHPAPKARKAVAVAKPTKFKGRKKK